MTDSDSWDEARRWAEPRDYYGQMSPQIPNELPYGKNKHHTGNYETNFKVSGKKVIFVNLYSYHKW